MKLDFQFDIVLETDIVKSEYCYLSPWEILFCGVFLFFSQN